MKWTTVPQVLKPIANMSCQHKIVIKSFYLVTKRLEQILKIPKTSEYWTLISPVFGPKYIST